MKKLIIILVAILFFEGCITADRGERENEGSRISGGGSGGGGPGGGPGGAGGGPGGGPGGPGGNIENAARADRGTAGDQLANFLPNFKKYVEALPARVLDDREAEGLLLLREAVRFAEEVKVSLAEEWGISALRSFAKTEQTRTKYVKILLVKHKLPDPVKFGVQDGFRNGELKAAYAELPDKIAATELNALTVAIRGEEVVVGAIEKVLASSEAPDVRILCHNLYRSSRFQMRTLVQLLEKKGSAYDPGIIPGDLYKRILNSKVERSDLITDPGFYF